MASRSQQRRPQDSISAIYVHNTKDEQGKWEGAMFEKDSWVYMQPSAIGPHRVRCRGVLQNHWKGRVLRFREARDGGLVASVQHVYGVKDLKLPPGTTPQVFPSNYIFPSNLVEDQPLRSLTGTYRALHVDVGEAMLIGKSSQYLVDHKIFFYKFMYKVPASVNSYGSLELLPSPSLNSLEWPIPDEWSLQTLKMRITHDIHSSLKFGRASRSVGLSWFVPIHVFACIFKTTNSQRCPSMFICKNTSEDFLNSTFERGWDEVGGVHKGDIFSCRVVVPSITFRYLIARSTLYMRFYYRRWMRKAGQWIPLESTEDMGEAFDIQIHMPGGTLESVTVSDCWSLFNLREHLVLMGSVCTESFHFRVGGRKMGKRTEKNFMLSNSLQHVEICMETGDFSKIHID